MHSGETAGVKDQTSKERFSEITSGRSRWQQGLVATCKDSSNEVKNRSMRRANWIGTCARRSKDRGVMSSQETVHVSLAEVTTDVGQRGTGCLAVPTTGAGSA